MFQGSGRAPFPASFSGSRRKKRTRKFLRKEFESVSDDLGRLRDLQSYFLFAVRTHRYASMQITLRHITKRILPWLRSKSFVILGNYRSRPEEFLFRDYTRLRDLENDNVRGRSAFFRLEYSEGTKKNARLHRGWINPFRIIFDIFIYYTM